MVIGEEGSTLANKSVIKAFEMMRKNEPGLLGEVYNAAINISDAEEAADSVCDVWDTILEMNNTKAIPDFILDLTTFGPGAEAVNYLTLQLGVPTLTAQYGQEGDILGWEEINFLQQSKLFLKMFNKIDFNTTIAPINLFSLYFRSFFFGFLH